MLVVALLDDRCHRAREADAVATHEQRLLLAVLVEEARVERLGVLGAELEDVADLDCRGEGERAAAVRADIALSGFAHVGELRLEVASGLDPAQMPAVAVRAGHELPDAERLVGHDAPLEPDRAERPTTCAERVADLFVGCGTRLRAERGVELRRLDAVVAADEREHDAGVRGHRHRL